MGLAFAVSGVREGVIRRNFDLTGLKRPIFYRFRLGFALAGDVFDLLAPGRLPAPRLHPRSLGHAKALGATAVAASEAAAAPGAAASRGPAVLLTAHFGNWEAQAAAWRRLGVPLLGAARPIRSSAVAAWVAALRARHDVSVIHSNVPRAALRHLRAGGCFGLLWDQHAPSGMQGTGGAPGEFLGARAALDPLPFFLLAREPCPVYFGVLLPGGALRLVPLLDPARKGFPAGRENREGRLARRYHRVLATLVRARPELWHGVLHARFKAMGNYPGHREGKDSSKT
jgi:lauroyl/myristoyl acyltransferase